MKDEIVSIDDNLQSDNTESFNEFDDELVDIDTEDKGVLNGFIKLVLILVVAGIVGFMFSDVFMSFANWIIFN